MNFIISSECMLEKKKQYDEEKWNFISVNAYKVETMEGKEKEKKDNIKCNMHAKYLNLLKADSFL